MDAVIAHSRHTARRLQEIGVTEERIRVIPHGAFDYLTRLPHEAELPPSLAETDAPVILFFGLLRPYKGLDVLLEAFQNLPGAELWIVGSPRMDLGSLRVSAHSARGIVRMVPRFIAEEEIPALMRRADVLVLPYLDAEQSGVLYTGLAFGKPMVVSAVGGFPEVAEDHAAVRLVPPGDADALAAALEGLVSDPAARAELEEAARRAAAGPYSWDSIAAETASLYEELAAARR
jgi:glycosyltransferase involved in cell wall biosynthesis